MHEDLSYKKICSVETEGWPRAVDGSCAHLGGGAVVMLYAVNGSNISLSFKLEFSYSNNEAEYSTLIIGSILQMGDC